MFRQALVSVAAAQKVLLHAKTAQTAQKVLLDANPASARKVLQTARNVAPTAKAARAAWQLSSRDQNAASQVVMHVLPIAEAATP